jgi:hypothetical protein
MTSSEFRARWVRRREELARLGAQVDGARIIDEFVADFDSVERDEAEQIVSIGRAAELSGYSAEHLARCVRDGRIANAGRRGKPMIRRGDLPHKANKRLARTLNQTYDPAADARDLLDRRGER